MARGRIRNAAAGTSPRPEVGWTRAAGASVGIEPDCGRGATVYLPALVADLSELARMWTGYPVDGSSRAALWEQARELRRRIARADPETRAVVCARADRMRGTAELAFRC